MILEIEAMEHATVAAVSPSEMVELPGWLVPLDSGTVGRAHSAVPLSHDAPHPDAVDEILAIYAARGLAPAFRVPRLTSFDAFRDALAARGLRGTQPTQVLVARATDIASAGATPAAEVDVRADAIWTALYTSDGFDVVDGAHRARLLARSPGSLFASIRDRGVALATGVISLSHGWAGIHGMRTASSERGRGLASRVLRGLAEASLERGHERVLLQVESENATAQRLYRRHGFATAWTYEYWRPPRQ